MVQCQPAPCPCAKCHEKECLVPVREINDLILLQSKIAKSELNGVPAQKQTIQNNKLMCDLYYKRIWDAVRLDQEQETHIREVWDKMPDRYLQIAYWLILAGLLREYNCVIYDEWGLLEDTRGDLNYIVARNNSRIQNCIAVYSLETPGISYLLKLEENKISLNRIDDGEVVFASDFSDLLDEI